MKNRRAISLILACLTLWCCA